MLFIIIDKDDKRVKVEAPFKVYGSQEGIQALIKQLKEVVDKPAFGYGWVDIIDDSTPAAEPPVEDFDKLFGKEIK